MSTVIENRLLTTRQAAEKANVTDGTIRRWVREERLPASKTVTGVFRIDVSDLERVLKPQQQSEPAQ